MTRARDDYQHKRLRDPRENQALVQRAVAAPGPALPPSFCSLRRGPHLLEPYLHNCTPPLRRCSAGL